jgi:hypothetical protein
MRHTKIVNPVEMVLAEDDPPADVRQPIVAKRCQRRRHAIEFVARDRDVHVAMRAQPDRRIENVPEVSALDDDRTDAGGAQGVEHAPQLARPNSGERLIAGHDGRECECAREQRIDAMSASKLEPRGVEGRLAAQG